MLAAMKQTQALSLGDPDTVFEKSPNRVTMNLQRPV